MSVILSLLEQDDIWTKSPESIIPKWFQIIKAIKEEAPNNYDYLFENKSGEEGPLYKTLLFDWVDQVLENQRLREENLELRYRPGGPGALEAEKSFLATSHSSNGKSEQQITDSAGETASGC